MTSSFEIGDFQVWEWFIDQLKIIGLNYTHLYVQVKCDNNIIVLIKVETIAINTSSRLHNSGNNMSQEIELIQNY